MKYDEESVIKSRHFQPSIYLKQNYDASNKVEFDKIYKDFIRMLKPDEEDREKPDEKMGFDVDRVYLHPETFKRFTAEAEVYTKRDQRDRFRTLWAVYGPNMSKEVPEGVVFCLEGYYREE